MNNQEIDLYMITIFHFDNILKSLAPILYSLLFALYIGNNIIFGQLLLGTAHPFQYVTFTLCIAIVINYFLIKLCSKQQFVSQEVLLVGIGFSIFLLTALLSYELNQMVFYSMFIIKGWIGQMINEIHLQGEYYSKSDIICFIGISIGAVLCTFQWTFQIWGILLGWIGSGSLIMIAHNIKRVRKMKTHIITQYAMVCSIIVLGLFYPVHSFKAFDVSLIIYATINGVLFPLCCTLYLHGLQIGPPAMQLSLIMIINISGAALQIGHSLINIIGILICVFSVGYLIVSHKSHIEVGGFEIEPEENPYYELHQYNQRV